MSHDRPAGPVVSAEERRRLIADAATDTGLDRTLTRLHDLLREAKQASPGVQGSFERMLRSIDDGLPPDDATGLLVDRYRRGVVSRTELLSDPKIAARLRARMGGGVPERDDPPER